MGARSTSVLFLAPEPLRPVSTGPARRTVKLAEATAEHCRVTLAAPAPSVFPDGPFDSVETGPGRDRRLGSVIAGYDVAVVQVMHTPRHLAEARRSAPRLVVDLIAPVALEAQEIGADAAARRAVADWRARELTAHVAAADLVLCNNERQRDLIFGVALAEGLLDDHRGASANEWIRVVPHGLDAELPPRTPSPLRDGLDDGDRLAVWAGGMWSWLDPLTAIRAMERLRPKRPDVRLAFIALEHPDPDQRRAFAGDIAEAIALTRDRGLEDVVSFRPEWLPYDDYVNHLRDADVGVCLHGTTLESRFAARTRVLDYLSVGLPVLCSRGDAMAELVASRNLGSVVEPLDVDGCAAALDALTSGDRHRGDRASLEPLEWRNAARPLVEYCRDPGPPTQRGQVERAVLAARGYSAFVRALYRTDGAGGIARAVGRRAAGALRR